MKVKELIERLQALDPELLVVRWDATADLYTSMDGWNPHLLDVVQFGSREDDYFPARSSDENKIEAVEL